MYTPGLKKINSSVDKHVGCYHSLAALNNVDMNIGIQVYI